MRHDGTHTLAANCPLCLRERLRRYASEIAVVAIHLHEGTITDDAAADRLAALSKQMRA